MTTQKKHPGKDHPSVRYAGVVMEEIHDEREVGIITCVEIFPREAMTIVELPVFRGHNQIAQSRGGAVLS